MDGSGEAGLHERPQPRRPGALLRLQFPDATPTSLPVLQFPLAEDDDLDVEERLARAAEEEEKYDAEQRLE